MKLRLFIFSLSLFLSKSVLSQVYSPVIDTLETNNNIKTDFNNDINSSNLFNYINYNKYFSNIKVEFNNRFNSNVSKLNQNFFRDYNESKFNINYKLSDNFETGAGLIYNLFSDDRNIGINKNTNIFIFSNSVYNPLSEIDLNLKTGYIIDDQIGEVNSGFKSILNANLKNFVFDDYFSNGKMNIMYENLSEKLNYNAEISGEIFKQFEGFAENTGYIKIYNRRSDLYFPATTDVKKTYGINNNTESRIESFIGIEDKLNYLVSKNFLFSVSGFLVNKLINRDIKYRAFSNTVIFDNSYNSKITENNLGLNSSIDYYTEKFQSRVKLQYSERSENHEPVDLSFYSQTQARDLERIEKNKNNSGKRTTMYFDANYLLTNTHSFKLSGSSSLLKYDTDSDENNDDRDELYLVTSLSHKFTNYENFELETTFDFSRSHLKYIFAERSSNNNVNNIYKLTSSSIFLPFDNFLTKNSVSVLANYTVYDFEDLLSQVQSFSFRQFYVKDSTSFKFTNSMNLDFIGELKLSEQGEFFNDEFSVNPLTYFEDQNYNLSLWYEVIKNIYFSAGLRYFEQKRYDYVSGIKTLKNRIINSGPVVNLRLYLNNNSFVKFTYIYDNLRYSDTGFNQTSSSVNISIQWNL